MLSSTSSTSSVPTAQHVAAGEGKVPFEWGTGSNGYVYFVANTLGGALTQLPHVTPAQVGTWVTHRARGGAGLGCLALSCALLWFGAKIRLTLHG